MDNFYAKYPVTSGGGVAVDSLNTLTGDLTLAAGTGISITDNGLDTITVAATSADVTLSAFGSTPNANGATLTGQALNLQPASGSFPGGVSTSAQTFAGDKTFSGVILASDGTSSNPGVAFSSDANTGLVRSGADTMDMVAGSYVGVQIKKSTGNYANVGMGTIASSSDDFPLIVSRSIASSGTVIQVNNPNSAANSAAQFTPPRRLTHSLAPLP